MTYCIDTSALITAWGEMYPIENFPPIWDNFQQLIDDDPIQRRQAAIMAAYPKLIDQRKGHFAADPWVIAVAIERGLHLVTLERLTGKANRPNIPDVCADAAFKAPCINLLDLIRREKWVLK